MATIKVREAYGYSTHAVCRGHYDGSLPMPADAPTLGPVESARDAGPCEFCSPLLHTRLSNAGGPVVGSRVCGGEGEDYDEGVVEEERAGDVYVAWDSGVKTWSPIESLTTID